VAETLSSSACVWLICHWVSFPVKEASVYLRIAPGREPMCIQAFDILFFTRQ
jgi:hypothetical protein